MDFHSLAHVLYALRYNPITWLQTFINNPHRVDSGPYFDRANAYFVVGADYCYKVSAL